MPLLEQRLRRLWPLLLLLAVAVTFGWVLYDPYNIDGDAVAYMDLSDLIRSHHWAGVDNAYWNPLYPALLAAGASVFRATRMNELRSFYLVNYGVFLLQLVAGIAFADALTELRNAGAPGTKSAANGFLLSRTSLRYLIVALLLISTGRELSIGKVRPDALLQALLLLGLAALLRHLASGRLRYAALMGLVFGLAYLTKSFAFLFSLLAIATLIGFRLIWHRHRPLRIAAAAALAGVCFALVAGPYIAALSKQKGHFDFGDSGALNYAWFVGGTEKMHLEPEMTDKFGSAAVHLKHPEVQLPVAGMRVYSYAALPYGTYPDWFDTTYFNDGIKPHFNLKGELSRSARDGALVVRYMLNHPEPLLLLAILLALGGRLGLRGRPGAETGADAFWLPPVLLGAALWVIYGMVNIEERYVTAGYLAMLLPVFASLRVAGRDEALAGTTNARPITAPARGEPAMVLSGHETASSQQQAAGSRQQAAAASVLLLFLLAIGESVRLLAELRRQESITTHAPGWYDPQSYQAAEALAKLGVHPGDEIACIGTQACLRDHYWARLAGVRILTEIYDQDAPVYDYLASVPAAEREAAYAAIRSRGAKVIVGAFDPGRMTGRDGASAGWIELGDHTLYALPLAPLKP